MYKIVRIYQHPHINKRTISKGLTLDEAQAHCKNPETSSSKATSATATRRTKKLGPWMDTYEQE